MEKKINKKTSFLAIFLTIVSLSYFFYNNFFNKNNCQKEITYSLDTFDERFQIKKEDFLYEVKKANKIWENILKRKLFKYVENNGEISLNLMYDNRQKNTSIIKEVVDEIKNKNESLEKYEKILEIQKTDYQSKKEKLKKEIILLTKKVENFNTQIKKLKENNKITKEIIEKVNSQKEKLEKEKQYIENTLKKLEKQQSLISRNVNNVNTKIKDFNNDIEYYTYTQKEAHNEKFKQGNFYENEYEKNISIYQFEDKIKLKRVLAHEFGHALGMRHVENKDSILYWLNESDNVIPTKEDIEMIKSICK